MDNSTDSGLPVIVFVVIAVVVAWVALKQLARSRRRKWLMEKYRDAVIVKRIMAREIWQGMTKEQLIDSLGSPLDRDEKVFKTKLRETFKYDRKGRNRYGLRIMIENDTIVGWQQGSQR